MPFVVGAYAAMPAAAAAKAEFLEILGEQSWVSGLEIPYPGGASTSLAEVARYSVVRGFSTLTLIPGTMGALAQSTDFGLASPQPTARAAALSWCKEAFAAMRAAHDQAGVGFVKRVQLHSAPTKYALAEAFAASIEELLAEDLDGARLVIEHCDAWTEDFPVEKGFLSLADEIAVAQQTGIGLHLNWGRSVKETRTAAHALESVVAAREAGVLDGLMFSGISPAETVYGPAWGDAHAPLVGLEPTSLLTTQHVTECTAAARGATLQYLGAKVQLPAAMGPVRRVANLRMIAEAAGC